jgi:DNA-binding protein Fis
MEDNAVNKFHSWALTSELDEAFTSAKIGAVYKLVVESVERPLIEKALAKTFGNQVKAAKILGINRNTLRTKINKLGIKPGAWKI